MKMFVITEEWIKKYTRNPSNGSVAINASQCKILGFEWSEMRKGWIQNSCGKVISNASKDLFERLHNAGGTDQSSIIAAFKEERGIYSNKTPRRVTPITCQTPSLFG